MNTENLLLYMNIIPQDLQDVQDWFWDNIFDIFFECAFENFDDFYLEFMRKVKSEYGLSGAIIGLCNEQR